MPQLILSTAPRAEAGKIRVRSTATVSAVNPTSRSNTKAPSASDASPSKVSRALEVECSLVRSGPTRGLAATLRAVAGTRTGDGVATARRVADCADEHALRGAACNQCATAERDVRDCGNNGRGCEGRDEQQGRARREAVLTHDVVGDHTEDSDRGEAARRCALDDHEAHQHGVDPVAGGEAHCHGRDDGDGSGTDRAHGGDGRAHREHRPRHEGHSSSDRADCRVNDPVDRAVVSKASANR